MGISLKYINEKYPEMKVVFDDDYVLAWAGRFYVNIRHSDIHVNMAPRIGICFYKNYPRTLPEVFDLDKRFANYSHVFVDIPPDKVRVPEFKRKNRLCLATNLDMHIKLIHSYSIENFIESFLLPYFVSYEGFKRTGKYVFGERAHNKAGIIQSFAEYFYLKSQF